MRIAAAIVLAMASTTPGLVLAQEIPAGVRYQRAPKETNDAAAALLANALANPTQLSSAMYHDSMVCGPMLWMSLRPIADTPLLDARPYYLVLPALEGVAVEAKRIRTADEWASMWRAMFATYPELARATVRAAKADEIGLYAAEVPYAIREPFLAIDAGQHRFFAHLTLREGKPLLIWIERVDDLQKLKR